MVQQPTAQRTEFDRNAVPTNLITVRDWAMLAEHGFGGVHWTTAMRKYAQQRGGALCLLADGRLRVLTRLLDGRLRQTTYPPQLWGWAERHP